MSSMLRKIFTDYFPPPHFLEMPAVGLDISDEVVRFVELKRGRKGYQIGRFGFKKLPKDIVEEGYIKDRPALTKILAEIQREQGFRYIVASFPEEKSYLFKTQIPVMDEADIQSALKFKIEENVPVALNDAVYDYTVMKQPVPGDTTLNVIVTVTHIKAITRYLTVMKEAGFIPLELHTESQALAKIAIPKEDKGTHLIVALRETKTLLVLVSEGFVHYTSTVPIGSDSIAESLKKEFSIDEDEVERIREGKETRDRNEMFMSLVNAGSVLRDEIRKVYSYWESHGAGQKIDSIILSGADALLGLDTYLSQSFDSPAYIADAWQNIPSLKNDVPKLTKKESLDYLPALGLIHTYD